MKRLNDSPRSGTASAETLQESASTKASAWKRMKDPRTGRIFFYNAGTGKSTWDDPLAGEEGETAGDDDDEEEDDDEGEGEGDAADKKQEQEEQTSKTSGEESLPDGWVEMKDPKTGRIFFYSKNDGKSQWERPLAATTTTTTSAAISKSAGAEESTAGANSKAAKSSPWTQMTDPKTQRPFWYNKETGKSTWDPPSQSTELSKGGETKVAESGASAAIAAVAKGFASALNSVTRKRRNSQEKWAKMRDPRSGRCVVTSLFLC